MSRVKLLFVSVMAVFAVGAVVASEASAAPHWVINGTPLGSGSESVLGLLSGGSARLVSKIGTVPTEVVCTTADATGTILAVNEDAAPSGIQFTSCKVEHPSGCTVKEPITTVALTSELLSNEVVGLDTWTPTSGTEFTSLTITGTACSVESKTPVTGKAQCEGELNKEAETYSCLFTDASSKGLLKLGSNEAQFLAHFLFLLKGTNDGKLWGVKTP
jgi:hypothetical protein